jgi:hypothetical protein
MYLSEVPEPSAKREHKFKLRDLLPLFSVKFFLVIALFIFF